MVIDFSKISKNDVMTAGGKGANLGEMVWKKYLKKSLRKQIKMK